MPREIRADFSQTFLLPPALEDWVDASHPARFVRAFVESLDFEELGIDWNESPTGRPTYSAELLLMVWLHGYFVHIRSTRKLEAACREQMGFLWLCGMQTPDHNTLWRFFERNKPALRRLFNRSVQTAVRADMVGMVLHAMDGTKILARASTRGRMSREDLEAMLSRLDEVVSEWEEEIVQTAVPDEPGTGIPEEIQDERRLRARIQEALREMDKDEASKVHLKEPQARVMQCGDVKTRRLAYNSQSVVDAKSGIIVAQRVSNEAYDQHQLMPMLDAVEEHLGACAVVTLADAGYASGEDLSAAEEADRNVLVNLPSRMKGDPRNPYHASHFDYDMETDTVICPRGEALVYKHTRKHREKGVSLRLYRCMNKQCPVRDECTKERKGRAIELGPHHDAIARQKMRQRQEDERRLLRRRSGLIEGVFGTIKAAYGFRRFNRHGLENAQTEWALICTTYNLKKLYKHWNERVPN